jgi:hypothetical protein
VSRDPREIPIEELTTLAKESLLHHENDEAVFTAMRNACGLLKLREASRERFREAIARVGDGDPWVSASS